MRDNIEMMTAQERRAALAKRKMAEGARIARDFARAEKHWTECERAADAWLAMERTMIARAPENREAQSIAAEFTARLTMAQESIAIGQERDAYAQARDAQALAYRLDVAASASDCPETLAAAQEARAAWRGFVRNFGPELDIRAFGGDVPVIGRRAAFEAKRNPLSDHELDAAREVGIEPIAQAQAQRTYREDAGKSRRRSKMRMERAAKPCGKGPSNRLPPGHLSSRVGVARAKAKLRGIALPTYAAFALPEALAAVADGLASVSMVGWRDTSGAPLTSDAKRAMNARRETAQHDGVGSAYAPVSDAAREAMRATAYARHCEALLDAAPWDFDAIAPAATSVNALCARGKRKAKRSAQVGERTWLVRDIRPRGFAAQSRGASDSYATLAVATLPPVEVHARGVMEAAQAAFPEMSDEALAVALATEIIVVYEVGPGAKGKAQAAWKARFMTAEGRRGAHPNSFAQRVAGANLADDPKPAGKPSLRSAAYGTTQAQQEAQEYARAAFNAACLTFAPREMGTPDAWQPALMAHETRYLTRQMTAHPDWRIIAALDPRDCRDCVECAAREFATAHVLTPDCVTEARARAARCYAHTQAAQEAQELDPEDAAYRERDARILRRANAARLMAIKLEDAGIEMVSMCSLSWEDAEAREVAAIHVYEPIVDALRRGVWYNGEDGGFTKNIWNETRY